MKKLIATLAFCLMANVAIAQATKIVVLDMKAATEDTVYGKSQFAKFNALLEPYKTELAKQEAMKASKTFSEEETRTYQRTVEDITIEHASLNKRLAAALTKNIRELVPKYMKLNKIDLVLPASIAFSTPTTNITKDFIAFADKEYKND